MEKEKVLEIEITKIDDNYSYCKIIHQNKKILKTENFNTSFSGSLIFYVKNGSPNFCTGYDSHSGYEFGTLTIKGKNNIPFIIKNKEIKHLDELVNLINGKYGIAKRWRAGNKESYYLMLTDFSIVKDGERYTTVDDKRYEFGNYLKTEEEALEYVEYMKKCSLEWHEKRDNNE